MHERTLYVSSDVTGPFQIIEHLWQLYKHQMHHIQGVELLALNTDLSLQAKIEKAQKLGFDHASIHGQTGSGGTSFADAQKVKLADRAFLDFEPLLQGYGQLYPTLFHTTKLLQPGNTELVLKYKPNMLLLENDPGKGHVQLEGVKQTVKKVEELQSLGINAYMVLDVCHALGADPLKKADFTKEWAALMQYWEDVLIPKPDRPRILYGIHLPIGTLKRDSLPINDGQLLPDVMLLDLLYMISRSLTEYLVIENQQDLLKMAVITYEYIKEYREYIDRAFDRLGRIGILTH